MDQAVVNFLRNRQMTVLGPIDDINRKLMVWRSWYLGKVDGFHDYPIYNGRIRRNVERKSLHMAKRVAQRWADLLLNEKVEVNAAVPGPDGAPADDGYTEKRLRELMHEVNFYVRGNNLIEMAFAMGGGFFVEFWDGERTSVKYIPQEDFYPLAYDSGRLTEAAFASRKHIGDRSYIYVETHRKNERDTYTIENLLLETVTAPVSAGGIILSESAGDAASAAVGGLREASPAVYEAQGVEPFVETDSTEPLFQMIRPNIANADDFNSPYGTSVFDGAVDIFKSIDTIYDSYYKEFLLGKKRIFARDGVTNIAIDPKSGEQIPVFDPQDEVFYSLPGDDAAPIQEVNGALRVGEHNTALQTQLNLLASATGLGDSGFTWDRGNVSTATQIISENSDMFRTLKKHELVLREAIIGLAKGLLYIESRYAGDAALRLDAEITVDFDDSIIEDTAEIRRQAMMELQTGLIDPIEYYQRVYHMTEDQAVAWRAQMQARSAPVEAEPPAPEE